MGEMDGGGTGRGVGGRAGCRDARFHRGEARLSPRRNGKPIRPQHRCTNRATTTSHEDLADEWSEAAVRDLPHGSLRRWADRHRELEAPVQRPGRVRAYGPDI